MDGTVRTTWPILPHTKVKHLILRRYLQAWLPIMVRHHGRVLYVDGFAGPGRYEGGEEGSPLIALRAIREHALLRTNRPGSRVDFLFVEGETDRANLLKLELSRFRKDHPLPNWITYKVVTGAFHHVINAELNDLGRRGEGLPPTFAFVDPFGYTGVPFESIARIVRNPSCECLITFMLSAIRRALRREEPTIREALQGYFGTSGPVIDGLLESLHHEPTALGRQELIVNCYRETLEKRAGLRYVRTFAMLNRQNQPTYFLIFGTHNRRGLSEMKRAMWAADPERGGMFSDRTDAAQMVLFEPEPDLTSLKRLLVQTFRGRGFVRIEDIATFVLEETPYSEQIHLKTKTLKPMEDVSPPAIEVKRPPGKVRRSGAYAAGTRIKFSETSA